MSDKKKKILFLAHWYPNEIDHHKGIFIKNHAESLSVISELTVVAFDIRNSNKFYRSSISFEKNGEFEICRITVESRFYKLLYYFIFFQYWLLKRSLRKSEIVPSNYDLLISNVLFPSGIVAWKLAKSWNLKLIHIEHWSYFNTFLKKDVHRYKAKRMLSYIDRMIVVSDVLKNMVKEHFPEHKIDVVPNVVDPPFGYKEKDPSQIKRFLAISNWQKPKNPFPYLEALEQLSKEYPIQLTMVGKGPILEGVKKRKWSFQIDYPGSIKHHDLGAYFHKADYFLHGSDFETFSIVCVEALITGTPVIANNVGILPMVIDESNGVLLNRDCDSWRMAIDQAIKTGYDHFQIAEKIKETYSINKVTSSFQTILNRFTPSQKP